MDRLDAFGKQVGFNVESGPDVVRAVGVPCLLQDGLVGSCVIEKFCDPSSGRPDNRISNATHAVRIRTDEAQDGRVYHADGEAVGNHLDGDGRTWSDISIKKKGEDDKSAKDVVHRYAKQIVGAVAEAGYDAPAFRAAASPFKIPNTFEDRSGIGPVQDSIRGHRIAIIGLGGTGSYILDLLAKTPVEIHLLDSDDLDWHNFMRAPGAPTTDEIESQHSQPLSKVAYYHTKYSSLREGIHAHAIRVDSTLQFAEFLEAHPIDFAFVGIDQLPDSDSPRQDAVYEALSEAGIPFIDSGVSITVDDAAISGAITTSSYPAGSMEWKYAIPNARARGDLPGYRNVQIPEVNAMAASLAVMEWRRRTGQYISRSDSFLHRFRLEGPRIVVPPEE